MLDAAAATTDPGGGALDTLIPQQVATIAQYGLLGATTILLSVAVVVLIRKLISLFESRVKDAEARGVERVNDWRELKDVIAANTQAWSAWTTSNEARTRAIEASVAAQQASTVAIQNLVSSIATLHDDHGKLQVALQGVREAILARGGKL